MFIGSHHLPEFHKISVTDTDKEEVVKSSDAAEQWFLDKKKKNCSI